MTYTLPHATRLLARLRTDRRGRFGYAWRFRHEGHYSLVANYPRQPGGPLPDRTCPRELFFDAG